MPNRAAQANGNAIPSRACPRRRPPGHRPAEERQRRAAAVDVTAIDRRDRRGRRRSAAWRLQRSRQSARCRFSTASGARRRAQPFDTPPGPAARFESSTWFRHRSCRPGPAAQPVRGLAGEYFDNPQLQGPPRLTRTDARLDFRWTLNSPGRGIPFDWYSARWTGTIAAPGIGRRPHRRGRQRRLSAISRRQAHPRQLAEAFVRHARRAGGACAELVACDSTGVFRDHRQCAGEARLGCRHCRYVEQGH